MSPAMWPNPELKRSRSVSPSEDLALTKAAAWAWHQRTTASSGRLVHPFETGGVSTAAASPPPCRPSRYKLEADAGSDTASSPTQPPLSRSASLSLLDAYELRRISSDLDSLILQARIHRQQPAKPYAKYPRKSKRFWRRHVAGFCGSGWSGTVEAVVPVRRSPPAAAPSAACR